MNSSERQALRQVVRQRMKVLRSDVAARQAELEAEIQERIAAQYAHEDKICADLNDRLADILDQANKDMRDLVEKVQRDHDIIFQRRGWDVSLDKTERHKLYRRLHADVAAQVAAALLNIERTEADLIQELVVDGLESEAANKFLGRIPTVGDLVPASRLLELTADE